MDIRKIEEYENKKEYINDYHSTDTDPFRYTSNPLIQELLVNELDIDTSKITELVESILSPDNLHSEVVSYMTKSGDTMTLQLSILQSFPIMKMLNISEEDLISALKNSKYPYDDSLKIINVGLKVERKTVILLNAPEGVSTDEIKQFFGELSSEIREIKNEIENTWFITFTSEEKATNAVLNCIGKKFGGTKVNVRMKSENLVKNVQDNSPLHPAYENPSMYPQYWQTNNIYLYQNHSMHKHDFVTDDSKSNRNGQSRYRGKGNRKNNSRFESKEQSLQIMGNGDIVYAQQNNFNSRVKQNGNIKEKKVQTSKKIMNHHAPPLGISHFPPLGNVVTHVSSEQEYVIDQKVSSDEVNDTTKILKDLSNESQVQNNLSETLSVKREFSSENDVQSVLINKNSSSEIERSDQNVNAETSKDLLKQVPSHEFKDVGMRLNWAEVARARSNK